MKETFLAGTVLYGPIQVIISPLQGQGTNHSFLVPPLPWNFLEEMEPVSAYQSNDTHISGLAMFLWHAPWSWEMLLLSLLCSKNSSWWSDHWNKPNSAGRSDCAHLFCMSLGAQWNLQGFCLKTLCCCLFKYERRENSNYARSFTEV